MNYIKSIIYILYSDSFKAIASDIGIALLNKSPKIYTPERDKIYSGNDFDDLNDFIYFYGAFRCKVRDILSLITFRYPYELLLIFKNKYLEIKSFNENDILENGYYTYDSNKYVLYIKIYLVTIRRFTFFY